MFVSVMKSSAEFISPTIAFACTGLARGDSSQNEAEKTDSAAGDAVVDGGTPSWEKYNQFEGMTDEHAQVSQLFIE